MTSVTNILFFAASTVRKYPEVSIKIADYVAVHAAGKYLDVPSKTDSFFATNMAGNIPDLLVLLPLTWKMS